MGPLAFRRAVRVTTGMVVPTTSRAIESFISLSQFLLLAGLVRWYLAVDVPGNHHNRHEDQGYYDLPALIARGLMVTTDVENSRNHERGHDAFREERIPARHCGGAIAHGHKARRARGRE